jgi:hypothetical protein
MIYKKLARALKADGHDRLVKDGNGVLFSETLLLCVLG